MALDGMQNNPIKYKIPFCRPKFTDRKNYIGVSGVADRNHEPPISYWREIRL